MIETCENVENDAEVEDEIFYAEIFVGLFFFGVIIYFI